MKKAAVVVIALLLIAIAGTYFYFSGKEYVVRITESDIQQKLAEKLPLTKTYLFIFQVTLDNPRVLLQNGSNRVSAGLDVLFNITVNDNPIPLGGTVDVTAGIRYSDDTGEFFLTDPVVEHLEVQGIPQQYTDKANTVLSKALTAFYNSHPIYTFSSLDMKQAAARMILKDVVVENSELVILLGI